MGKYLVTGGAGFIGSHVAEELYKKGHEVRIIDDFSTGKRKNLSKLVGEIDIWDSDVRDLETCNRLVKGIDVVIHLAALTSIPRSIKNPILANDVNITGTLNMLLASKKARIKRFVFASSSSVYGNDECLPKVEDNLGIPLSPYAVSKLASEHYCHVFNQVYGLPTVCLRYFNVFGPRQDPSSEYSAVIPTFITKMIDGNSPVIFGNGIQSRDFTYVSNVVDATILASTVRNVSGKVFNIGCNERTTVMFLALSINKILNRHIVPVWAELRLGDVSHSFADISKARKLLKYEPLVPFNDGLRKTINWFRKQK